MLLFFWGGDSLSLKGKRFVHYELKTIKGESAVMPTDKICGRSLSSKIPVDMNNIFMKLYVA
jgi:hypothetical protein